MITYYHSPVGVIKLEEENGFITALSFVETVEESSKELSQTLIMVIEQLDEYFAGKRINFDLPLEQNGTSFQQKAWDYLKTIPYGETVSYKDEAIAIGNPKGCRAVGSANGRNKIAIIVPCHRVVNENGRLGGYAYGLEIKRRLLEMEQNFKNKTTE